MGNEKWNLLRRYYIQVEYKDKGYTNSGSIFLVIWEILKNPNAKIIINS